MLVDKLERYRNERKLSKAEFAEFIGTNKYTYSHIISGRRPPSADFLTKLELATELPKEYWINENVKDPEEYTNELFIKEKKVGSTVADALKLLINTKTLTKPEDIRTKSAILEVLIDALEVDTQHLLDLIELKNRK